MVQSAIGRVSVRGQAHPIDKVCASWTVPSFFFLLNKKPRFLEETEVFPTNKERSEKLTGSGCGNSAFLAQPSKPNYGQILVAASLKLSHFLFKHPNQILVPTGSRYFYAVHQLLVNVSAVGFCYFFYVLTICVHGGRSLYLFWCTCYFSNIALNFKKYLNLPKIYSY